MITIPIKKEKKTKAEKTVKNDVFSEAQKIISEYDVKIPFFCEDSNEVDFIRDKIERNKIYLKKCENPALYKQVEKDTLFLENQILPILSIKTNLFYSEVVKTFIKEFDKAVKNGCNSLIFYTPINDEYNSNPICGVSNCRDFGDNQKGSVQIEANFWLRNKDGNYAHFEFLDLNKLSDNQALTK